MDLSSMRETLREGRPPVELVEFSLTYQRTRVGVNVAIVASVLVFTPRFDSRLFVAPALIAMAAAVLAHVRVRPLASLQEKITFDTAMYLGMVAVLDLPEVALFVATIQGFVVYLHVPPRTALILTALYLGGGVGTAAVGVFVPLQQRTNFESVLMVAIVAVIALVPVAWVLSQVGTLLLVQREREASLLAETKQILADKDRFVASVSHELRTPLTAVVGLAHTLADRSAPLSEEERAEFSDVIVEQSEEVAAIVDDLLVAARADSGHLTLVVGELDLSKEVSSVAPDGVPVVSGGNEWNTVVGDPIRVRQVLRNLVSNSARYGGPNKRIRLSTRGVLGVVEVQDDGEAIPAAHIEGIFTPYGRAHDRPGRTDSVGLGLTVSRQLARMMGGDVTYRHDGKWATFELALPLSVATTAQAICASPEAALAVHKVGSR